MTAIIINHLFTKANRDLDGGTRSRVLDFITKLQRDPSSPGLDLKMPQGAVDRRVRTARVNDFWRAVLFELPDSAGYVLVSVKPHDDAYTYASRLRMTVNDATGALEVLDQVAIAEAMAPTPREEEEEEFEPVAATPAEPRLKGLSAAKLTAFGISADVAERALTITDQSEFDALIEALPELQGCALLDLAAGKDPDAVYAELIGMEPAEKIDTEDIAAALLRPTSRLDFASGAHDDLLAAIGGDLKSWRIWLHPQQRRLAYHDGWNGPFRVTGGAGTGKTVTALHRARHLAERALASNATGKPVLVATFTKNLAEALRSQLEELAGPEVAGAVDVVNLDSLAHRILTGQSGGARVKVIATDEADFTSAWDIAAAGSDYDPDFLRDEWLEVVLGNGVTDLAGYLKAPRPGRGVALNRAKRTEVYGLLQRAEQNLRVSGVMPYPQAVSAAAAIVSATPALQYRHAVIDEAQDLHPAHWRLVRSLVPEGPDDLFIVGDGHQRIYGKPLVLSRYRINTRGRSRRLTINYRTSEQILRWTLGVMGDADVDDLEGEGDPLAGARSEFRGPEPTRVAAGNLAAEDEALVAQVRTWLQLGYQPEEIGVLSRVKGGVEAARSALDRAGIGASIIDTKHPQAKSGHVQVMTMHRAKGLEFPCVAITRLGLGHFPPKAAGWQDREMQERALLYVAGSRAREWLVLLHTGTLTPLAGGVAKEKPVELQTQPSPSGGDRPVKAFISYSRNDSAAAKELVEVLQAAGVEPWVDQKGIRAGAEWANVIARAIKESDVLVALLSATSNRSRYVLDEVHFAAQGGRRIIPVRLDESEPEEGLRLMLCRISWYDAFGRSRQGRFGDVAAEVARQP